MNIKVGATASVPWMSVTNDGREIWGVARPFAALAGGVAAVVAGGILAYTSAAMFVVAPLIAARGRITWKNRQVQNPIARVGVAYLAATTGLVASIGAMVVGVVMIPVAPAVSVLQSVVHAGGRLLRLVPSARRRSYAHVEFRNQPRLEGHTTPGIPARSVSLAVPRRTGLAGQDRELR